MNHLIYIADDEDNIRNLIKSFLESDGYRVRVFVTGDELLKAFSEQPSDLVILDIMMPGTDGWSVCKLLRDMTNVPIIMLTARDSEHDYVRGITIGSDDYLTKPFRPTTLLMRVRSLLRRMEMNENIKGRMPQKATVGDLTYDSERNEILCQKNPMKLSQTEMRLLAYMMENPEKAYSRDELLNAVWGYDMKVETRVTDETLRRIRKRLTESASCVSIKTIWGFGYKLDMVGDKK